MNMYIRVRSSEQGMPEEVSAKEMDNKEKQAEELGISTSILNSLQDQICVIDHSGKILFVNDEWIRAADRYSQFQHIQGVGINYLQTIEANTYVYNGLLSILAGKEDYFTYEYSCHTPTEKRWNVMQATPLLANGSRQGVVLRHVDVTRQKLLELQLKQQAETDSLTGLYNRRYFEKRLDQEIRLLQKNESWLSLLSIDVDNFKTVNDKYGHLVGDIVLKQLALLIRGATRESDIPARIGGDEFAVLLPETNSDRLKQAAAGILRVVQEQNNSGRNPYPVTLNISIGGTCFSNRDSLENVLLATDRALYEAKNLGKNQINIV